MPNCAVRGDPTSFANYYNCSLVIELDIVEAKYALMGLPFL